MSEHPNRRCHGCRTVSVSTHMPGRQMHSQRQSVLGHQAADSSAAAAMISLCTAAALLLIAGASPAVIVQKSLLVTSSPGHSVTLSCSISGTSASYFSWFRQVPGQPPKCILTLYVHSPVPTLYGEFTNETRFKVQKEGESFNLTISDLKTSDMGRYYCGVRDYDLLIFGNGTFLLITGSESNRTIVQWPVSVPVQPGDSVTLQCTIHSETCAGEHSVHWFRHGSGEALPGLIYTHGNRSDPCESSSEPGLPAQGCVYELPKRNLRSSDAGTYYCAVATCGQILFGNGTRLDIAESSLQLSPAVLVLLVSNCVCVLVIAVLVCTRRGQCGHGAEHVSQQTPHRHTGADWADKQNQGTGMMNYAALSFTDSRTKPERKRREMDRQAVYSQVQYHQTD
ncbi:KV07 protein, partial [Amia calva]|nr:KV07 protein [Amia calva]